MLHNPRRKWKEKSRGEWHCNRKVNWNNVGGGEVGRWEKKVENGGYLKRRWWFGYGGYSPQNMNLWVIVFISHSSEWALRVGIPFPFSLFPSFFFSFAPHMCAVCFLSFSAPSSTPPSCSCHLIPCFLLLSFFNILPTLPLGFSFFLFINEIITHHYNTEKCFPFLPNWWISSHFLSNQFIYILILYTLKKQEIPTFNI